MSDHSWVVRSNDGWQQVSFTHLRWFGPAEAPLVVARVVARGTHWDRQASLTNFENVDLVDDLDLSLPQVVISKHRLVGLQKEVGLWLEAPREFKVSLGPPGGSELALSLGQNDRFICSAEKPVFSFWYTSSRFSCRLEYVVDQSCLALLKDELTSALGRSGG